MAAIGELMIADQSQKRLVDEGGRVEGLAGLFVRHQGRGPATKFIVYQRQEPIRGAGFAAVDGLQELGDVVHKSW